MAPNSIRTVDVADGEDTDVTSATRNANTLQELISTIPVTWRSELGVLLTQVYRTTSKLCNIQNTIAQYDRYPTGSFPPSISNAIKRPTIQFCKEFETSPVLQEFRKNLEGGVQTARQTLFNLVKKAKNEELAALQKEVKFDEPVWRASITDVSVRMAAAYGCSFQVTPQGTESWTGSIPESTKADCRMLWKNGSTFHYRVIALARSIADRALAEKVKNLSIKAKDDIVMTDANTEKPVREVIDERLKISLGALESRLLQKISTSQGQSQRSNLMIDRPALQQARRQKKWQQREQQTRRRLEPPESHQEGAWPEREREGRTEQMTVSSFLAQCSKDFRSWRPESYPNVYQSLSFDNRLKINVALMKPWEVETLRTAKPGVFKADNVVIPEHIEYMLSVNHKFILHQDPTKHDVDEGKLALQRSVRNRWFFRDKISNDFIPRFHIPNPQWEPPTASPAVEQGIRAAFAVIDSQVSRALSSSAPRSAGHYKWSEARDWLQENALLVKLTDKNLGLAVFPVTWYDTTILQMLSDTENYTLVPNVSKERLINALRQKTYSWDLPPKMGKYIVTKMATNQDVPEFHCIPKVHKTPWTLRPIVPSHSWITTATSEVLDYLCQPILEKWPWIVSSSKEVINQLEDLRTPSTDPIWILTGDVTAFYTNIPPKKCASIIATIWKNMCRESAITYKTIAEMVKFVMDNNYFAYRGQTFHQVKGLAMGTACAPVVANLYAGYFERRGRIPFQDGVLLYNRYIDDILCVFQGTHEEAIAFTERVKLGPLRIVWSVSPSRNEFLDIDIIREPGNVLPVVHTKLFRKTMNRHLYIPWSSAHPSHVKKGFVKAELTRFATLCSKVEWFAEARQEFYGNLRRRGYPSETLIEWFNQVQYGNRPVLLLRKKEQMDVAPLILPGHYNPVWDYINANEVITEARRFWEREELPESLQQSLIRGLGRTTSLFDLMSVWNKTILLSDATAE